MTQVGIGTDLSIVMAGLVPAIHAFLSCGTKDVDARDKRGHDDVGNLDAQIAPNPQCGHYPALSRTPARKNFCGSTASPSIRVS